jgi:glutathione S-transferase
VARAVSNEMLAGFAPLRAQLPMNIRASLPGRQLHAEVRADLERIERLWAACRDRQRGNGPFLFGAFTIADAMFAPVVTRIRTYGVRVSQASSVYCDAVLAAPEVARWCEAARQETWRIAQYET